MAQWFSRRELRPKIYLCCVYLIYAAVPHGSGTGTEAADLSKRRKAKQLLATTDLIRGLRYVSCEIDRHENLDRNLDRNPENYIDARA